MEKIGNTWELIKQSFTVLKSDKELMLLPIASAISCLMVSVLVLGGGALVLYPEMQSATAAGGSWQADPSTVTLGLFVFYFANYCVIVFFNVALIAGAYHRMAGRSLTLREMLSEAWARKGRILQWAVLAATVGVLLKLLERRVRWVGQIVIRLIGLAWALASFFVAPVLAFEDLGPVDALKRSAGLLRENWGKELVGGFSFGVIFFLLSLPAFALGAVAMLFGGAIGVLSVPPQSPSEFQVAAWRHDALIGLALGGVLMILYFLLLAVVRAAVRGIFVAALYRYASTHQVAAGFRAELFEKAWLPKRA